MTTRMARNTFFTNPVPSSAWASLVMKTVLPYRRLVSEQKDCLGSYCKLCADSHLTKVQSSIEKNEPITFVLPAFPGKSPNLSKVLGPLPDLGEHLALKFLNDLCEKIKKVYSPGAKMILCSDGRVFSDVIGMIEKDVTDYQRSIKTIICESSLSNLSVFSLDEIANGEDFNTLRAWLMDAYGSSLEVLRKKVIRGGNGSITPGDQEAHRMFCGITRFLVDDLKRPNCSLTKNQIQKDCKARAYQVVLRSNAWSEFIAERYPNAVRLSIHPQECGSPKLGIQLIGKESWMTPWHGVAVETNNGPTLMKKWEAEALGASLVFDNKLQPSHFRLSDEGQLSHLQGILECII